MKLLLWIVLAACSSYAKAFDDFMPIDLKGNYIDAGIHANANSISNLAMLELENISGDLLSCTGVFHSGPEPDVIRKAVLEPGAEKVLSAKFFRNVIKLNITLNCERSS